MSLAPILKKILLVDLFQGLGVTFRYQKPKEIYTEQYPMERPQIAERYRGLPRLNNNADNNQTLCIACDLCALACPEHLIVVKSERDPVTKKKVMTSWTYDASRCMFCGICEDNCPTDCLELSQDYEFATFERDFIIDRKRLEKGYETTVYEK